MQKSKFVNGKVKKEVNLLRSSGVAFVSQVRTATSNLHCLKANVMEGWRVVMPELALEQKVLDLEWEKEAHEEAAVIIKERCAQMCCAQK